MTSSTPLPEQGGFNEELDEILYDLIMLNRVSEAGEVETDAQFLKAKQAIIDLVLNDVIGAHITPSNYRTALKGIRALRAEQRAIITNEDGRQ